MGFSYFFFQILDIVRRLKIGRSRFLCFFHVEAGSFFSVRPAAIDIQWTQCIRYLLLLILQARHQSGIDELPATSIRLLLAYSVEHVA